MKEEVYQSMYHQIHLNDQQKHKIWAGIKEEAGKPSERRKARLSLRSAVCVCAVLVASGITVLAANPSYVDRIAEAVSQFGGHREATPEENELYAAYGSEAAVTWELENGTIRLDAILYDKAYLYIPVTIYPNASLTPGEDVSSESWYADLLREASGGWDKDGVYSKFRLERGRDTDLAQALYINPIVEEDGSLTGSYHVSYQWEGNGSFAQGDVIQRVKRRIPKDGTITGRVLGDDESPEGLRTFEIELGGEMVTFVDLKPEDEVIAEFRLEGEPLPQKEISTAGVSLPYGLTADRITISPLALYMYGTGDSHQPGAKIIYNLFVVLKDGTVIGNSACMSVYREDADSDYIYELSMQLGHALDLDEIAGVRITDRGEEICFIPAE
ncbi:MAG: hypothetical protein HDR21_07120 [Lachnospiraceae bacterium]|nr:hypothetical protein [Lachnospiraceae bacterium]MBD5481504.1 hypothetical protein [Lachnospiraceae bacterium]